MVARTTNTFEGSEAPHALEIESKSNIFIRTKNFSILE
jgi:hypothetical protein